LKWSVPGGTYDLALSIVSDSYSNFPGILNLVVGGKSFVQELLTYHLMKCKICGNSISSYLGFDCCILCSKVKGLHYHLMQLYFLCQNCSLCLTDENSLGFPFVCCLCFSCYSSKYSYKVFDLAISIELRRDLSEGKCQKLILEFLVAQRLNLIRTEICQYGWTFKLENVKSDFEFAYVNSFSDFPLNLDCPFIPYEGDLLYFSNSFDGDLCVDLILKFQGSAVAKCSEIYRSAEEIFCVVTSTVGGSLTSRIPCVNFGIYLYELLKERSLVFET